MRLARPLPCALAAAVLLGAAASRADAPPDAEALFNEGVRLMDASDHERACPKIAESLRLDPRPGTTFTLARCEDLRGRPAEAIGHYEAFMTMADRASQDMQPRYQERRDFAAKRAGELYAELTLRLPPGAPDGVSVEVDGSALPAGSLGLPSRRLPGAHRVVVRIAGSAPREQAFQLGAGEKKEVVLAVPESKSDKGSNLQAAWIATGCVGAAGLLTGAVAGIIAATKKPDIDRYCDVNKQCDPPGLDAVKSAQAAGNVSTAAFIVGLAGAGAAATLFVLDQEAVFKSSSRVHPFVTVSAASARAGFTW